MKSPKVKKIVSEIQKKEKICPQSFLVLVLKMQGLTDSLDVEFEEHRVVEKKRNKRPKKKPLIERGQYIDGQRLTKNEIAFENFFSDHFDTHQWLKRNGIDF